MLKSSVLLMMIVVACGGSGADLVQAPDLPPTTAAEFESILIELDKPAVVNVWASWCLPCRAEAPLFDLAFVTYGDDVEFIGLDVQDSQQGAKAFLAEFGLEFDHYFDRSREVANHYAGIGTPITFFFGPDGELISTHNGVLDERTLALNIDELLALSS